MTFEQYYNTFGGTLRPIRAMDEELRNMEKGTTKFRKIAPTDILTLVEQGTSGEVASEDMAHSLFSEVGGDITLVYNKATGIPTKRTFRSKFAKFWFKKYVAPRILYRAYTADAMDVLFKASDTTAAGERGCKFEDIFHELPPLGKWKARKVPDPAAYTDDIAGEAGTANDDTIITIDFTDTPVLMRRKDDKCIEEANIDAWPKKSQTA